MLGCKSHEMRMNRASRKQDRITYQCHKTIIHQMHRRATKGSLTVLKILSRGPPILFHPSTKRKFIITIPEKNKSTSSSPLTRASCPTNIHPQNYPSTHSRGRTHTIIRIRRLRIILRFSISGCTLSVSPIKVSASIAPNWHHRITPLSTTEKSCRKGDTEEAERAFHIPKL